MDQSELFLVKLVWSIFPFILLFLITIGNVLTVLVFTRSRLRHRQGTIYLVTLTVVDFVALYTGCLLSKWAQFGLGRINRLSPSCSKVGLSLCRLPVG